MGDWSDYFEDFLKKTQRTKLMGITIPMAQQLTGLGLLPDQNKKTSKRRLMRK